jgi:hypothetical protein
MNVLQDQGQTLTVLGLCALVLLYPILRLLWRVGRRRRRRSEYYRSRERQRNWSVDRTNSWRTDRPENRPIDSAEQFRLVMAARFAAKRVMSKGEYAVFKAVEAEAATLRDGYRVFAQTSLGEVLWSENGRAYSAINSKRVDVLVIGATGLPVLAIEHQGPGHYQGDAAARDAVKKEALRRAGVAYLEVSDGELPEAVRAKVREILRPSLPNPTQPGFGVEPQASDR